MILKGSTRGGPVDLALHLQNELDNENVVIHSIRGAIADDLYGAFREWQVASEATRMTKPLYSVSINPDPSQRDWTDQEWDKAIDHIETRLELSGQPRAVVFHEKVGEYSQDDDPRRHCHVVWSRTQVKDGKVKAVHLGHDYYALRTCARELAREMDLELRFEQDREATYDYAQSQGKNRDPETAERRKETVARLWREHEKGEAFTAAMRETGYVVAKGDKSRVVIVDRDGQVHALARQIAGVRTRQIRDRLGDPANLPSIEQAKDEQRIRQMETEQRQRRERVRIDLNREQRLFRKLRRMAQRADRVHQQRRGKLQVERKALDKRHEAERDGLGDRQHSERQKVEDERARKEPKGLVKQLCDVTGLSKLRQWIEDQEDRKRKAVFEKERHDLERSQRMESDRLDRKGERLQQQETREIASLDRFAKKLSLDKEKALEAERQRTMEREMSGMELEL